MKKIETAYSKYCDCYEVDNNTVLYDFGIKYDESGNEHHYTVTEKYDDNKNRILYQDSMGYGVKRDYEGDFIFEHSSESKTKKVYNRSTSLILSMIDDDNILLFSYNRKNQCVSECSIGEDKAIVHNHETPVNTDTPIYKCLNSIRFPEFYGLKSTKKEEG